MRRPARRRRMIAAAVAAMLTAACAGQPEATVAGTERDHLIALLLPESNTARYESHDRPAFEARIAELCPTCRATAANAGQDPARQQAQAEAALTNGADVLVLDPVDSVSAAVIVQHADAAGVPVVTYDRLVLDAPVAFHVTFDNEVVGALQARALVDEMALRDRDGEVVMLNGSPTDANAAEFREGAQRVLDASDLTVGFEVDVPDWSPDRAQEAMEQALATLGRDRIAGVYSANDGMAAGAIAAMKASGLRPLPPITGQDAELAAIRRILAGEQHMTVYKALRRQAAAAAEVAVSLARSDAVPADAATDLVDNGHGEVPTLLLEPLPVTRGTIRETVVADGFWERDEICRGLEAACAEVGL